MVLISHLSTYLSALYTSYLFYIIFAYLTGVSSIYPLSSYVLFTIFLSGFSSYENKHSWLIKSNIVTIRIFVQSKCVRTPFTPSNIIKAIVNLILYRFYIQTKHSCSCCIQPTLRYIYPPVYHYMFFCISKFMSYFINIFSTLLSFRFYCLRSYLLDWLLLI